MFGFGKRRKDAAKQEAQAIGARHVELINQRLEDWRATSLDSRRGMLEDSFADRLVTIEGDEGLTFEHVAQLEALALLKNWLERRDDYFAEFVQGLTPDTLDIMVMMQLGDAVQGHLERHFAEATDALDDHLNRTISDELARRGEVETPQA